ncbi:MAG: putative ABC transport system permease protein [Parvibaculaceae bacterium]|jgi:putative ABC transport system permease protein
MTWLGPIPHLALRSLLNRRLTAGLTVLAVALSVTLFLGVEKIRLGARSSFDNTISSTDLIVGARSGAINLLLYSVFRVGDATNNISWRSVQDIQQHPDIAWTIPLSLGDSMQGFRVLGTTNAYFEHYKYGRKQPLSFAQGAPFKDLFDTVVGAEVARSLSLHVGDPLIVAHGLGNTSFALHDNLPFEVAGILEPTGTPLDRTVHVSLAGLEAVHRGWESGRQKQTGEDADDLRSIAPSLEPASITALLVGLKSRVATLKLQRQINEYQKEPLLAIIPGVALSQLWDVVSVAERALSAIAGFVIIIGLMVLLTSLFTSLNERRREMALLRALGARPWHIAALLTSEATLLAGVGSLLGVCLVNGLLYASAPIIETHYGVTLNSLAPGAYDGLIVLLVTVAGFILGLLPAALAYRRSLADGLTVRL